MASSIVCEEDLWGTVPQLPVRISPEQCPEQLAGRQQIRNWGIELYRVAAVLACLCLIGGGAYAILAPDGLYWQRAFGFAFLGVLPAATSFAIGWAFLLIFEWLSLIFTPVARIWGVVQRPLMSSYDLATKYLLIFMKRLCLLLRANCRLAIKYFFIFSSLSRHASTYVVKSFYPLKVPVTFPVRLVARIMLLFYKKSA